MTADVDVWHYFKRHFKYLVEDLRITGQSNAIETPVSKKTIDWRKQLLEKDLVILVATEYWLPELGFGFIKPASGTIDRFAKGQKR